MVFRFLPHGKSVLGGCNQRNSPTLRPLNPSFSTIVDRCWWSSITIVNRGSLPQIVLFNDHGSFKLNNDHDRKLQKRRSRIVVVANDRRSSLSPTTVDRSRHRRPEIVSPTTVVMVLGVRRSRKLLNTGNHYLKGNFRLNMPNSCRFLGRIFNTGNRYLNFLLKHTQLLSFFRKDFEHSKSLFER